MGAPNRREPEGRSFCQVLSQFIAKVRRGGEAQSTADGNTGRGAPAAVVGTTFQRGDSGPCDCFTQRPWCDHGPLRRLNLGDGSSGLGCFLGKLASQPAVIIIRTPIAQRPKKGSTARTNPQECSAITHIQMSTLLYALTVVVGSAILITSLLRKRQERKAWERAIRWAEIERFRGRELQSEPNDTGGDSTELVSKKENAESGNKSVATVIASISWTESRVVHQAARSPRPAFTRKGGRGREGAW